MLRPIRADDDLSPMASRMSLQEMMVERQKPATSSVSSASSSKQPKYVLYVHPKCPTSEKLKLHIQQQPAAQHDLYIQNVLLLKKCPEWLNGVPILADTTVGVIYRGTDCLVYVDKLLHSFRQQQPPSFKELYTDDSRKPTSVKQPIKLSEENIATLLEQRAARIPQHANV